MWISKIFSSTLTTIWEIHANQGNQCSPRVAMSASTKIKSAKESDTKLSDFDTRLSLYDTGTNAYLR
jgi:hypothetical protein